MLPALLRAASAGRGSSAPAAIAQRAAPAAQLQARRWFNVHEYQVG